MTVATVSFAEEHFEELIERALGGEEICISDGGGGLVRIEPLDPARDWQPIG